MIELSSASPSGTFSPMVLVSSPPRSVCSTTASSASPAVLLQSRLKKYHCREMDKLKRKYRLQHTSCFTHLQSLIHRHRVGRRSLLIRTLCLTDELACLDIQMSRMWREWSMSRVPGMLVVFLSSSCLSACAALFTSIGHGHQAFVCSLLSVWRCAIWFRVRTRTKENPCASTESTPRVKEWFAPVFVVVVNVIDCRLVLLLHRSLFRIEIFVLRNLWASQSWQYMFHEQCSSSVRPCSW